MKLVLTVSIIWIFCCVAIAVDEISRNDDGSAPLLTSDFGIVTDADRRKDRRSNIPFLPTPGQYHFYWQCLKLQKVRFNCTGVMRAGSGRGCQRDQCIPEVRVLSDGATYTFMTHQVWCVEAYHDLKTEIKRLLHREKVACFGSEYIDEVPPEESEGKRSSVWFLKRIKTPYGKWDYFPD